MVVERILNVGAVRGNLVREDAGDVSLSQTPEAIRLVPVAAHHPEYPQANEFARGVVVAK